MHFWGHAKNIVNFENSEKIIITPILYPKLLISYFFFFSYSILINFVSIKTGSMKKVLFWVLIANFIHANHLYFIENQGQWDSQVYFLARLKSVDIWITTSGITYDFYQSTPKIHPNDQEHPHKFQKNIYERKGHIIHWKFLNANNSFTTLKLKPKSYVHHYYLGKNPQNWKNNVKLYEEIILKNVYKGIDLRCYFENGQFRYDFWVNPFADYQQIAMQIIGSENLQIIHNEPVIKTSLGDVHFKDLKVIQQNHILQAQWKLHNQVLTYDIKNYDPSKTLIIDPILWSTFIHSTTGNDEKVTAMTRDKNFNPIITGYTSAQSQFPTTVGAYNNSISGSGLSDIFVMKLNTSTSQPIFSAFIGGDDWDYAWDIVTDTSSTSANIFICGETKSVNLPSTAGSYSPTPNINISTQSDIFIASLAFDGSTLNALTYYGGDRNDVAFAMDRQNNGNIVVTGYTSSANLPMTVGTYDTTPGGGITANSDVFVAIFNPNLSVLNAATYIGGGTGEFAYAMTISYGNQVIIAGKAKSTDYPTVAGAHSVTHSGMDDAFASVFTPDLTTLQASTFLGGNDFDAITDISLQQSSFVATGFTLSNNFPTSVGCYDNSYNGGKDAFLVVLGLPPGGSNCGLSYSSFIGGDFDDEGTSVHFTTFFNTYVCGTTNSSNFPMITPFDNTLNDNPSNTNQDAFVIKFPGFMPNNPDFSTFVGGTNNDLANEIIGIGTEFIIAGETQSTDYPTTTNAYQPNYNSQWEGFVTKMGICNLGSLSLSSNSPVCEGQTIQLNAANGFSNYQWTGPNGFTSSNQNPTLTNATASMSGYYKLTATQGCTVTDSIYVLVIGNQALNINDTTICPGNSVQYTMPILSGANYVWYDQPTGGTPLSTGINFQTPILNSTTTYYVEIASANCTSARDAFTINVVNLNTTSIQETSPITVCQGNNVTIHGNTAGANTHLWYSQASGGTPLFNGNNFTINNLQSTTTYFVEAILSGCTTNRIPFEVQVPIIGSPNPAPNIKICAGQSVTITVDPNGNYDVHWFDSFTGGNIIHQGTTFTTPPLNQTTYYYIANFVNGCYSIREIQEVEVIPNVPSPQVQDTTICSGTTVNISLTANSPYSITWYDAPNGGNVLGSGSTLNVNVNQTTTFYAEASITNCTSARVALTVFVTAQPNPPLVQDTTICSGSHATIYAQSQAGNGTFLWYTQDVGGSPIFTGNPFITNALNQNTNFYVEFVVGNCTSTRAGMQVNVIPKPNEPTIIYSSTICYGDSVHLISNINASQVLWYDSPTSNIPIHIGNSYETPNLFQNTTYYVETVNPPCTSNRVSIPITIIQLSNPQIDTLIKVCEGSTYILTTQPPQGVNTVWFDLNQNVVGNSSNLNVIVNTTQQYYVAYTVSGCTSEKVLVTLQSVPLTANASFTYDSLGQGNYVFYNSSQNGVNYIWYFVMGNQIDSIIQNDTSAIQYTFEESGNVQIILRVYDINGCYDEQTMSLEVAGSQMVIWIPTGFTPNDDDVNDEWFINHQGVKDIEWYLYDRWGNLIFQTNDVNYRWDGKYQGKTCPEGVYSYLIWAKDFQGKKKKYIGSVTLIR